jgi:hypothetical protein
MTFVIANDKSIYIFFPSSGVYAKTFVNSSTFELKPLGNSIGTFGKNQQLG